MRDPFSEANDDRHPVVIDIDHEDWLFPLQQYGLQSIAQCNVNGISVAVF